ncbi:antiviral innate immune response receptor RIG-I-like isoform X2 [Mercenaria mercenaria]|uniref:antiviral innate immune response receptor RIG-I-like isoform X2 n=1 Tax=Mercenaria mercenaria TaxID=6596 RepID=UPI00234F4B21|nr:antiviral innate immune response receptor RIG-I-like isoform X2 [Mercenaria mercenaria]
MSDESKASVSSSDSSDVSETDDSDADSDGLKPRKYQLELAENALMGNNTIICSGTGSGKTIVAMHIIKKHLEGAPKGERKVVFMARTGALIKQQAEKCKQCLPQYETRLITGDEERTKSINMFMQHCDILCFTPQILVNSLDDNLIESLSVFSLLVLDECHNTRGNEPYAMLMRKYLIEKCTGKKELPQIVGLTASVGVGKSRTIKEAEEYILRLCACLDVCHLSTVKKNEKGYKKHIKECTEETIRLEKRTTDPARGILLSAMKETEGMLEENGLMQPDISDLISEKHPSDNESQEYNKWTVEIMKAAQLKVDDYDISRDISSCAKYLNIYNSALEVNKLLRIKDIIRYLAEKHKQEGEHKSKLTDMETQLYNNLIGVQKKLKAEIKWTDNPNVQILSKTLCTMFAEKGAESRAMIFVKTRATCRSLAAYLDEDLQKNGIKASPLYGKEDRAGDEGMTENVQTDILKRFREGIYKVLVCTAVGNEGIDVPDCNIVLSYEYSGDEITKIQMKGRARQMEATAVTMGSEKILEQERTNAYKALMMSRALDEVCKLDPKLIKQKIVTFQKEEIQKYRFKKEASKYTNSKKSSEDAYEILCGKCNTFACNISDVRQMGHDHIVVDKTFEERIIKKEHKRPKTYDGIFKKYKMYCKKCPLDWGIIGIKDGLDCMTLKITNLKFKNLRTGLPSIYKKWKDMPYDVQKIGVADLPDILNDDVTTIRVGRAKVIDASKEQSLQTESTKCAEKETRKRKLNVDTSAEPDEGSKSRKYTATSTGNIERDVSCSVVQQDMNTTMQDIPNTTESKLTDVQTNDYMTSTSMARESSIGHPLKKSQDDTLSESMLKRLYEQMQSVGIFIAKQAVGTVFRVGSKYLMTAHHVVKGLVMDDSVYVTFHEYALAHQKEVYRIEKVIFLNQDLDVAVLELANSDSTLPPKMQLSKDDVDILNVKEVSLIGYGHPGKSYIKHLDPRCKLISAQSHRFLEAHTWLDQNITYIKNAVSKLGQDPAIVDKGYGCYADNNKIIFDCFMQQGASGSPALTYNNYGQVKVAGILTHGLPEFYFLMPELTRHLVDSNHRFEVASKMSSIYSSILNENEDLANDLFE